ncbi:MAG: ATP-binding protein [Polyangiales bacterium]
MPNRHSIRLLLVDDSEDDRLWIARLLSDDPHRRYDIDEAASIDDAIAKLSASAYDLAVVDWELPDGSGVELAQHPAVANQQLPIIVITGNERPEQGTLALGYGAADFLPKDDLTPRALARACAHAITRGRLERELETLRRAEVASARREREARVAAEVALAEERKARERVAALQSLSNQLGAATTSAEVAAAVTRHLPVFEHASALSVYALQGDAVHLLAAVGLSDEALRAWATVPLSQATPLSIAARTRKRVRVDTLDELRAYGPTEGAPDASWLAVPLASQDERIGVIGLRFPRDRIPPADGLEYIDLVARHVAQALHRARLYEEAQLAAEFEERLLAVVGHDLRTPLSAILMATRLLRERAPDERLVERLKRSARRMAELIADVLDRAAIRRGVASERAENRRDLESVVRDQVDELRTAMPQSHIVLDVRRAPEADADASRVAQVVSNLVRNAVQHGQPGAPVTVRLDGDDPVTLSVHNHGAPIAPDDLPHLFTPFKRGRRAGGEGTGLGLFIVKETAAALGGAVTVRSDPTGTTFPVSLPRRAAARNSPPATP